jgi:hypothetical protein
VIQSYEFWLSASSSAASLKVGQRLRCGWVWQSSRSGGAMNRYLAIMMTFALIAACYAICCVSTALACGTSNC